MKYAVSRYICPLLHPAGKGKRKRNDKRGGTVCMYDVDLAVILSYEHCGEGDFPFRRMHKMAVTITITVTVTVTITCREDN
ncbi:hypothetical protein POVWA2_081700 [Plasmodium ovale wallikeri]|uniref:Uncharacterized protein n=1 Tax=Plasmodium ovale wallikeri TaxID=864142 RepID=A0A1A9AMC8_PLAOA|nr:hypothetical protein POVWA2_081700 [Plasmodium ovale wallikeri]